MNQSGVNERASADAVSVRRLPPILMLGDHFGYAGGIAHGATVYFLNVLPALKRAGIDLTVCFLREPHPAAHELRKSGIDTVFLSASAAGPCWLCFVWRAWCVQCGCRIIHAAGLKATLVARIVGWITGARVIVHLHDLTYPGSALSALQKLFARDRDRGICVSRAAQVVAVKGYHLPAARLRVIYNGLNLDQLRTAATAAGTSRRVELGVSVDRPVIAMVARMHRVKGHHGMLQIMPRIVKSCPDALLLLIGDGPERANCEALVRELNLQTQVRFLGHRKDVAELLAASDVVVVPSQQEGLGLAAIEALAIGKPVVAYAVGGLPEVITEGVDGRLIEPQDQQAFADAVITLLKDRAMMQTYGVRAAVSAERFTLDRHIAALLDLYHETASQP